MSNKNLSKSLPEQFMQRISSSHIPSEISMLVKWLQEKRKVNIRINTLKTNEDEVLNELRRNKIKYKKFQPIKNCYIIEYTKEKVIEKLSIYEDGKIYFQNISSQVPVTFLWAKENETILDVTAAPGSKTSQIAAYMDNTWKLVANEIDQIRFERLSYNINHLWCKNVELINSDARRLWNLYKEESFDRILADLPCSAEGRIFLKNHKSFWYWSEKNILKHAKLQKQILSSIIPLLKSWWEIVYSTCTIAPEENEGIVTWLQENFNLKIVPIEMEYKYIKKLIIGFWDINYHPNCKHTIRCLPSEETEGFYIAKLRKK